MKTTLLTLAVAAALAAVAGCDRTPEQRAKQTPPSSAAGGGTSTPQANTPSTPANAGTPSAAEKREGSNPTQGQVDPKQQPQHKDFQQRGDGTGPKQPGG
jgi:hypothetical protein